jgi:hypothetical protein
MIRFSTSLNDFFLCLESFAELIFVISNNSRLHSILIVYYLLNNLVFLSIHTYKEQVKRFLLCSKDEISETTTKKLFFFQPLQLSRKKRNEQALEFLNWCALMNVVGHIGRWQLWLTCACHCHAHTYRKKGPKKKRKLIAIFLLHMSQNRRKNAYTRYITFFRFS